MEVGFTLTCILLASKTDSRKGDEVSVVDLTPQF